MLKEIYKFSSIFFLNNFFEIFDDIRKNNLDWWD